MQALEDFECLPRGSGGRHDHPVLLKDQPQGIAYVFLVVDEEDREAVRRAVSTLASFAGD